MKKDPLSSQTVRIKMPPANVHPGLTVPSSPSSNTSASISPVSPVASDAADTSRYQQLLESIYDAVLVCDFEGRIVESNHRAALLLGYAREELLSLKLPQLVATDAANFFEQIVQLLREGKLIFLEASFCRKDRSLVAAETTVNAVQFSEGDRIFFFLRNIERRLQTEQYLRDKQRMESLQHLAGGIAHEFNNLLTGVLAYATQIRNRQPADSPDREPLGRIIHAAEHAAELTKRLLVYSEGRTQFRPRIVNLNDVVREAREYLQSLLPENVDLEIRQAPDVWMTEADREQLLQVLMNLATNAQEAMPYGGRLTIITSNIEVTAANQSEHLKAAPGKYVLLEVHDTGQGIPPENLPHIFEPFFTTKGLDKAAGLGLFAVHSIMRDHRAVTDVWSRIGEGTRFRFYLPVTEKSVAPEPLLTAVPSQGHGRILFVDDEPLLRELAANILADYGYEIVVASDGQEALEIYRKNPSAFDLLITDSVMPRMNGRELYETIKKTLNPNVRVLFCSGYDISNIRREVTDPLCDFIGKPFRSDELVRGIQNLMALKVG